jgi:1-acyl-sn-glycerol-3-phosphate acyltransferase
VIPLPPRPLRRLVVAPALVVGAVTAAGAMPLWVPLAAVASRFAPGRWRSLRLLWFAFVYLVYEVLAIGALFGLWIASGFGLTIQRPAMVDAHYAVMGWFLRRVVGAARRTFGLTVVRDDDLPTALTAGRLLVFARHAGPGDSFLIVDALMANGQRRPRIVLKDSLQWDPAIDILLNRVPSRFVGGPGSSDESVAAIAELAATMDEHDAFVLFPEGGNFTPRRRTRAIDRLRRIGRADLAARAHAMEHLMPPKPRGALTALAAAPDADVLFVGHVGLEHLSTPADIWRGLHMDQEVVVRLWRIPVAEVPVGDDDRERWLYERWAEMDRWIGERTRGDGAVSDRAVSDRAVSDRARARTDRRGRGPGSDPGSPT